MELPNAELAIVNIRKIRDYCLDLTHDEGKRKARLFASVFGMSTEHAEELRTALLTAVQTDEAQLGRRDSYGQRYTVDFMLEWVVNAQW